MSAYSPARPTRPPSVAVRRFSAAQSGLPLGLEVLTLDGSLPVEALHPGERVITRTAGAVRLLDVSRREITTPAVEVAPGTLGDRSQPARLLLPSEQPVLLRDWRAKTLFGQPQAVAPVGALVDHGFICDVGPRQLTLFQLIFDRDYVIYAGGVEVLIPAPGEDHRAAA